MKKVLLICSLLVLGMTSLVSWNYYQYRKANDFDKAFNLNTFIDEPYDYSQTSSDACEAHWISDSEYIDTAVIPIQEEIHNIEISSDYIGLIPKHVIYLDSQAIVEQETLYHKSVYAKELKIKMIEINTKLDSLEKNY